MAESIGFVVACKRYFGLKSGQKMSEFAAELKALTPKDREEMAPQLSKALGVTVTLDPNAQTAS